MDNLVMWKDKMKDKPLIGCFVTFALPDMAEYMARLGFDFLLIDNEHGVMEQSVLADMVRASQCAGVPAVVRCTEKSYDHIQKALDFGANGIQLPLVNTAEDAKKVVAMSNFPPVGKRGVAFLPRAAGYGLVEDKKAYLKRANETKLLCCQVETQEAVDHLDEILAVEGIDVYFIGPGDLSTSVGMNTTDPEFLALVENIIKRITAAGKIAGYYVGSVKAAEQAIGWGARYLVTAITPYMAAGAQKFLTDVRTGKEHAMQVKDAY
ncbi:MAG: aldolase/citrate lyase family protein [Lachnospiraceae bacterium]|nr:aldolase/citrate lyase family protein [Lachnospiraceae bacterium]